MILTRKQTRSDGSSSRASLSGSSSLNEQPRRARGGSRTYDFNLEHSVDTLERRHQLAADVLKAHDFQLEHVHGQRISTAQWWDSDRMRSVQWNEVFIGKLPRDLFEDELLPYLILSGKVGRIRYMMDFSGYNRGYCFVKYETVAEALRAIQYLDGRLIRLNRPPIGAKLSFDNKCLFIGNLPLDCTNQQLIRTLVKADVHGISQVQLVGESRPRPRASRPGARSLSARGARLDASDEIESSWPCQYGYVHFETHEAATKARRILMPGEVKIFNRELTLDWAKAEVPSELSAYVRKSTDHNNNNNNNNNNDNTINQNQHKSTRYAINDIHNKNLDPLNQFLPIIWRKPIAHPAMPCNTPAFSLWADPFDSNFLTS